MRRLTNEKTAADLKEVIDKFDADGNSKNVDPSDRRYVKLAEYESICTDPKRLINADSLWSEIVKNRCVACSFHSFKRCRQKDKCHVSEILARIDPDRWAREAGCWK